MSDVPTSTHSTSRRNHHHHRVHRGQQPSRSSLRNSSVISNSRPETPLILSSFKPNIIPSISQPTPEEIQRDVDIVFHSMGLDSASPIRQQYQPYVNQEHEEEEE